MAFAFFCPTGAPPSVPRYQLTYCSARESIIYVTPRFTTSDPLRSGSTGFEAGQRIQFQSRSDLNWLAVLTESVYKLELHQCSHGSVRRCVDMQRRCYSENWRVTTLHVDEKLCFHRLSVHSKLELDCIEDSCATEESVATTFHTVLAVCSTEINSGSPPRYSMPV